MKEYREIIAKENRRSIEIASEKHQMEIEIASIDI